MIAFPKRRYRGPTATATSAVRRPLGIVLHEGPSPFVPGEMVVVIAILTPSKNRKTGDMVQVHILVRDSKPTDAIKASRDAAICGTCPMMGIGGGRLRACYVNAGQGPRSVWEAYNAGRYADYHPGAHDKWFAGRMIRFGAYGEPVLVPIGIVRRLAHVSDGWTGYTHAWADPRFAEYRAYFMASVHNKAQAAEAAGRGWRYFRSSNNAALLPGEFWCPASKEGGFRMTCRDCGACDGNSRPIGVPAAANVLLGTHGGLGPTAAFPKLAFLNN